MVFNAADLDKIRSAGLQLAYEGTQSYVIGNQ